LVILFLGRDLENASASLEKLWTLKRSAFGKSRGAVRIGRIASMGKKRKKRCTYRQAAQLAPECHLIFLRVWCWISKADSLMHKGACDGSGSSAMILHSELWWADQGKAYLLKS